MNLQLIRSHAGRLPLLTDAFPAADAASRIDVGLQTVPVEAIRGTVSRSQTVRRRDFMPRSDHQDRNWKARWSRLEEAGRRLVVLPPVDLVQVGDGYWVVDGHNRVALAHAIGQLSVDANVIRLTWPGGPAAPAVRPHLATVLAEASEMRAALGLAPMRSGGAVFG